MPKYKRLSDDDLLLTIDRTQAEIICQQLIRAKLVALTIGMENSTAHRQLVDTHILIQSMLEADLKAMEVERQLRP